MIIWPLADFEDASDGQYELWVNGAFVDQTTDTFYSYDGFAPGSLYEVTVKAVTTEGQWDATLSAEYSAPARQCTAPENIKHMSIEPMVRCGKDRQYFASHAFCITLVFGDAFTNAYIATGCYSELLDFAASVTALFTEPENREECDASPFAPECWAVLEAGGLFSDFDQVTDNLEFNTYSLSTCSDFDDATDFFNVADVVTGFQNVLLDDNGEFVESGVAFSKYAETAKLDWDCTECGWDLLKGLYEYLDSLVDADEKLAIVLSLGASLPAAEPAAITDPVLGGLVAQFELCSGWAWSITGSKRVNACAGIPPLEVAFFNTNSV